MEKYKTKIIVVLTAIVLLTGAWFLGGSPEVNLPTNYTTAQANNSDEVEPLLHTSFTEINAPATNNGNLIEYNQIDNSNNNYYGEANYLQYGNNDQSEYLPSETVVDEGAYISHTVVNPSQLQIEEQQNIQIVGDDHDHQRDPVEPEDITIGDESFTVTLTVRVDMLLNNMHLLNPAKHELVPHDGIIFPTTEVTAYDGESVFNVLQREMRRANIHMASRFTPIFNSAYVEAINNLYEFDAGALSGWMYSVNGWFPNFGASRYLLRPGDQIEWRFTVDLGRDLGVHWDVRQGYE